MTLRLFSFLLVPLFLFSLIDTTQGQERRRKSVTKTLAHIRLSGSMSEGPVLNDPLFGISKENFRMKLARIRKAKKDQKVNALLLHMDGISCGWARLNELRGVLDDFRAGGKKIYVYSDSGSTKDYLASLPADKVCMPPSGWLMLTGLYSEIMFYKNLLSLMGIQADFLWMGIYKFAAEPFTRTSMTPEARKQNELVIDDYFENSLVAPVSRYRSKRSKKLSAKQIKDLIDVGPFTAEKAKAKGLIDIVGYQSNFQVAIKEDLEADDLQILKDYGKAKKKKLDLSNPFNLFKLLSPSKTTRKSSKDQIALIYATGVISTGKSTLSPFGGETMGSTTIVEAIKKAQKENVKAIVLRVDSPGGSALASDLIWNALQQCEVPVIASMSDTAASGGYYISMGADKIFAQPGTLTGSIGVVGGKLATTGLYKKIGITTEVIKRGKNSGVMASSDPWTKSERTAMRQLMAKVYDQFLTKAMQGRAEAGKKFTRKEFLELAEGRIWTGRQALKRGLIDQLGGLEDALAEAKRMAKIPAGTEVDYLILPKPRTFLDSLLEGEGPSLKQDPLFSLGLRKFPGLARHFQNMGGFLQLQNDPIWLMSPHLMEIK